MDTLIGFLSDAFFAGMAAVGFAAVSVPPRRAFPPIVVLAALGHAIRWYMMHHLHTDIVGASLIAAILIGFGSYIFGRWWVHCPMTVLYIPALLPMIPGMYAYNAVLSLVRFVIHHKDPILSVQYMQDYLTNFTIAITVLLVLGIGSILPVFLLHKSSYTLSRRKKY
ncbi:threonine/serine exporter family protein [Porphyromonas gingivicanis]|uniref:threonine/serine exporter family protein n=1 Tax=Porphyromonas gingivicanis TaxID=266762 RepID=UPI000470C9D1|nr:threonine/serine exporter family protein [Porphyromonas gingivicanis]